MKSKKQVIDIEFVITRLIEGDTYRKISEKLGVPLTTLHDFTSKSEHFARAKEALNYSADTFADKAEQVLLDAKANLIEISRARELSQYYKWKAAKRSPQRYSDKVQTEHSGSVQSTIVHVSDESTKKNIEKL
jgi:hypothetical protein